MLIILLAITIHTGAPTQAQPPAAAGNNQPSQLATPSVEEEVYGNIVHQPLGDQTLEVLNLPELFLRRAADRVIRSSYQERYHVVVADSSSILSNQSAQKTDTSAVPKDVADHSPKNSTHPPQENDSHSKSPSAFKWLAPSAFVCLVLLWGVLRIQRGRRKLRERP